MSEPSQLVVRVQISKESFDAFCKSTPPVANESLGWDDWLSQQEYYGDKITLQNIKDEYCQYGKTTVGEFLNSIVESAEPPESAINDYDPIKQIWTYVVILFSENVGEYISMLNVLQHAAAFKDLPNNDYALIFDHIYEDSEIVAILEIGCKKSKLVRESTETESFIAFAQQEISNIIEKLNDD